MFKELAKSAVLLADEKLTGGQNKKVISKWFALNDCPEVKNSPAELAVYALCKDHAYTKDLDSVMNNLHIQFENIAKGNFRPQRTRKYLRENIYEHVARINDTEQLDKVIDTYLLIYWHNTGKTEVNVL